MTFGLVLVTACSDGDIDLAAPADSAKSATALKATNPLPRASTVPRRPLSSHVGSTIIVSSNSGGDTGGGPDIGDVGTQCSDESEGHQCTECTVDGESCECCGWTECWQEGDTCVCALSVDEVTCGRHDPDDDSGDTGSGGLQTLPQ